MKILLVAQNYKPFVGGVEVHVHQIAHRFLETGHEVVVAAAVFEAYRGPKWRAILHDNVLAPTVRDHNDDGVPIVAICPRNGMDRVRLLPMYLRATPRLRRHFAFFQRLTYPCFRALYLQKAIALCKDVDVVHSLASGFLGWLFREAAHQCGKPYADTPFIHPGQWADGYADVAFYKQCDAMIGLLDTDSDYIRSLGIAPERVHTIGVSPDLPEQIDGARFRAKHGLGDKPVVLYVGRMMRQKGAFALVNAMPKVWEKCPDVEFVFVGPGSPDEVSIFEGIDPRARYLGKVSFEDKGDALAACTVFCMPSMSEILPTVYLEAWSLGKPVLGGRAHGLPELIEGNGAGIAVSQEPDEIAEALISLLTDPLKRENYAQAGRRLVEERYQVSAVTGQLLELYNRLISERRGKQA